MEIGGCGPAALALSPEQTANLRSIAGGDSTDSPHRLTEAEPVKKKLFFEMPLVDSSSINPFSSGADVAALPREVGGRRLAKRDQLRERKCYPNRWYSLLLGNTF